MIVVAGYAIGSIFTLAAVAGIYFARQPMRVRSRIAAARRDGRVLR